MKTNLFTAAAMLFVPALLAACGSTGVDHVDLETSGAPIAGQFTSSAATVPVGVILAFQAAPKTSANKDLSASLAASTDDTRVAEVLPTTTDNQFVLIGAGAGTTTLHIRDGGREMSTLQVTVTPQ